MRLRVISTGSTANGYILESDKEVLFIEAGCKFLDAKKALNYDLSKIVGLICSHSHG